MCVPLLVALPPRAPKNGSATKVMRTCYCSVLTNPLMRSQPPSNRRPVLPQSLPQRPWDSFSWGGVLGTFMATELRFGPRWRKIMGMANMISSSNRMAMMWSAFPSNIMIE